MNNQSFDYQEFLKKRHAAFQTSDDIIKSTIQKATGKHIKTKKRLIIGESNEVYDIKLDNGKEVILRISHRNEHKFIVERWAMENVAQKGVPVASILLIDEAATESEKLELCVLSKIPGMPLLEMPEYKNWDFAKKIITEAGFLLAKVHSVQVHGFGELSGNGNGPYKTQREWIEKILSKKDIYTKVAEQNSFNISYIEQSIKLLKQHGTLFEGEKPMLCHSDISPKHLMVENEQITAILDFGNCHGASPIYDFSWWQFWYQNYEHIEWLKDGYTNKALFNKDFDIKFHVLKLLIGLELFWWNDTVGHLRGVEISKENIVEDIEYLANG